MSLKETIFSMMNEALNEVVEVRHDRYIRSHGKKARDSGGSSSSWMFTHKNMGDVNVNDKAEVHTAQGKFSDAKKSAQAWAKEHGHSSVYVMEEVEQIDEETMPSNVASRLADSHFTAAFHHKKNGNMKGYASHLKVANRIEDAVIRAGSHMPIRSTQIEKASDKAFSDHPHRVVKNEEVDQIDELSSNTLHSYINKAAKERGQQGIRAGASDYKSHDQKDAIRTMGKRLLGISAAASKLVSKANKNEEVELDEAETPTYHYYATRNGIGAKEMRLTHSKRKPFESETAALNHIIKNGEGGRGIIHKVNSATGKVVQHHGVDGGQKGYPTSEFDMSGDAPKHVRDLKEEVELDEAGRHLDYVPRKSSNTEVDVKGTKVPIKKHSWGDWEVPYGPHKDIGQHKSKESLVNALHTRIKEEVEQIDEISRDLARRYIRKVADKTNTGELSTKEVEKRRPGVNLAGKKAYPSIAGEPKVRATEEVELDEAKTDIYHKHMLKALGKTRLPKDHPYTSAVANNGDFVVRNGSGVVARIPKGEHNLK